MTEEFIKEQLDWDGWLKYKNGTEKFRKAIRLGLQLQLIQLKNLLSK
ncbi:MAG: hypothetical protein PHE32_04035 [Candidatus Shapirobacteria bacterium]|jgi:hypothetical protein|nr:hypothetical protein [Candidatus Shapirobacteria bacterium]